MCCVSEEEGWTGWRSVGHLVPVPTEIAHNLHYLLCHLFQNLNVSFIKKNCQILSQCVSLFLSLCFWFCVKVGVCEWACVWTPGNHNLVGAPTHCFPLLSSTGPTDKRVSVVERRTKPSAPVMFPSSVSLATCRWWRWTSAEHKL